MKREKKPVSRDYLRIVEWSQEDRCFVGSAPPLIGPCCHGASEASVLKQLKRIVEDWIRLRDSEGVVLPPPEAPPRTAVGSFCACRRRSTRPSRSRPGPPRRVSIPTARKGWRDWAPRRAAGT